MAKIWIITDDQILSECLARAVNYLPESKNNIYLEHGITVFSNAIAAVQGLNHDLPDLVILDVLLSGPDGFNFLNELISYSDTAHIPVIIVTSLDLSHVDLSHYNVTTVLRQETMTPAIIHLAVEGALRHE